MTPTTTTNKMRPELEPLPVRMQHLAIDKRGYVVPWFVPIVHGEPEFRCMDGGKFREAVRSRRCWVCGQALGTHLSFITGPMCLITGTNGEPPSHFSCATWSARNCPFLSKPQMVRREDNLPDHMSQAGIAIARNPGAVAVATMREYRIFYDDQKKPLIRMGLDTLEHVEWFRQGRPATRAEVQESVDGGLPTVRGYAELDGPEAIAQLEKQYAAFERWLPRE